MLLQKGTLERDLHERSGVKGRGGREQVLGGGGGGTEGVHDMWHVDDGDNPADMARVCDACLFVRSGERILLAVTLLSLSCIVDWPLAPVHVPCIICLQANRNSAGGSSFRSGDFSGESFQAQTHPRLVRGICCRLCKSKSVCKVSKESNQKVAPAGITMGTKWQPPC